MKSLNLIVNLAKLPLHAVTSMSLSSMVGYLHLFFMSCLCLMMNLLFHKKMKEITIFVKDAVCDDQCLGRCLYIHGVLRTGEVCYRDFAMSNDLTL